MILIQFKRVKLNIGMDSFKKYVQGTLGNWLLDPKHLYVGKELELPAVKGRNAAVVRIVAMDDKYVWLIEPHSDEKFNAPEYAVKVPISSLYNFVDDMSGQLTLNPHSGNEYIDAILDSKAEYLGKGEDGVTYHYKDKAIKVGTTVPFHPVWYNRPHLTPEEAIDKLRREHQVSEELIRRGVPGILPGQFILYDGRAFLIRPFVQVIDRNDKLTLDQCLELKNSVEGIHNAGYAIRDYIQIGLLDGHVYHYDLGSVALSTDKYTFKDEMDTVANYFHNSGFEMTNPPTYKPLSREEKIKRLRKDLGVSQDKWNDVDLDPFVD